MIRLFIALQIPADIREGLLDSASEVTYKTDFRLEKEDKIHLTLKFLGDVKEDLVDEIVKRLETVVDYSEIKCSSGGFSFFYRDGKPSVFKVGLNAGQPLYKLVKFVEDEMAKLNFPKEKRRFSPHLTLARIKYEVDAEIIKEIEEHKTATREFKCNTVVLYKSTLAPGGSIYKEIKKFSLKPLEE